MARGGGRSEWERQQAAHRREVERFAREQARQAKEQEKALRQAHLESQQLAADSKTAAVARQIRALDEILTSILPLPPLAFERLKVVPKLPSFDPGQLGVVPSPPDWNEYAPIRPSGLGRMFGGAARYDRPAAEARAQFESAMFGYRQQEAERQRALAEAKAEYERMAADDRAKVEVRIGWHLRT